MSRKVRDPCARESYDGSSKAPCVYRLFDKHGGLLYIGVSMAVLQRMHQHTLFHWYREIASVSLDHKETRQQAYDDEREAIRLEKPKYNVEHSGTIDQQKRSATRQKTMAKWRELAAAKSNEDQSIGVKA